MSGSCFTSCRAGRVGKKKDAKSVSRTTWVKSAAARRPPAPRPRAPATRHTPRTDRLPPLLVLLQHFVSFPGDSTRYFFEDSEIEKWLVDDSTSRPAAAAAAAAPSGGKAAPVAGAKRKEEAAATSAAAAATAAGPASPVKKARGEDKTKVGARWVLLAACPPCPPRNNQPLCCEAGSKLPDPCAVAPALFISPFFNCRCGMPSWLCWTYLTLTRCATLMMVGAV